MVGYDPVRELSQPLQSPDPSTSAEGLPLDRPSSFTASNETLQQESMEQPAEQELRSRQSSRSASIVNLLNPLDNSPDDRPSSSASQPGVCQEDPTYPHSTYSHGSSSPSSSFHRRMSIEGLVSASSPDSQPSHSFHSNYRSISSSSQPTSQPRESPSMRFSTMLNPSLFSALSSRRPRSRPGSGQFCPSEESGYLPILSSRTAESIETPSYMSDTTAEQHLPCSLSRTQAQSPIFASPISQHARFRYSASPQSETGHSLHHAYAQHQALESPLSCNAPLPASAATPIQPNSHPSSVAVRSLDGFRVPPLPLHRSPEARKVPLHPASPPAPYPGQTFYPSTASPSMASPGVFYSADVLNHEDFHMPRTQSGQHALPPPLTGGRPPIPGKQYDPVRSSDEGRKSSSYPWPHAVSGSSEISASESGLHRNRDNTEDEAGSRRLSMTQGNRARTSEPEAILDFDAGSNMATANATQSVGFPVRDVKSETVAADAGSEAPSTTEGIGKSTMQSSANDISFNPPVGSRGGEHSLKGFAHSEDAISDSDRLHTKVTPSSQQNDSRTSNAPVGSQERQQGRQLLEAASTDICLDFVMKGEKAEAEGTHSSGSISLVSAVRSGKVKPLDLDEVNLLSNRDAKKRKGSAVTLESTPIKDKVARTTKSAVSSSSAAHLSSKSATTPVEGQNTEIQTTSSQMPAIGIPYQPSKRVSAPDSVRRPLTRDELVRLHEIIDARGANQLRGRWRHSERDNGNLSPKDGFWEVIVPTWGQKVGNATSSGFSVAPAGSAGRGRDALILSLNEVARHYNNRQETGLRARNFSPILPLKNFNNWVKSVLIGCFGVRGGRAMDIGGGKGGDLQKWDKLGVRELVLADIAATSVKQAEARYRERGFRWRASFWALDCFGESLADCLPAEVLDKFFDTVSLQFCMHYGWSSLQRARLVIENASRYLSKGGVFIGTIPNQAELYKRLDALPQGELEFGNSKYHVIFEQREKKKPFGDKYTFFLDDAVDEVPEYVVDWAQFESLAMEYGLKLIFKQTMAEVWASHRAIPEFEALARKMKVSESPRRDIDRPAEMDDDLWEATTLYLAFAFRKVR